jgi:uncharacterized protein YcbX
MPPDAPVTTTALPSSPVSTIAEHRVRAMTRSVAAIAVTPVKAFALQPRDRVTLTENGVDENRRFLLVDANGARLRSSVHAWQCTVAAEYDSSAERLTVRLPGGEQVEGAADAFGAAVDFDYHGTLVSGRVVDGPWAEPLSALAGQPVRLVRTDEPARVQGEPVTLVSSASVERFSGEAKTTPDARRFRMLFRVDGCDAHEEDTWLGRRVRVGDAVVRVVELVERCVVTTRDPDTGVRDVDTLDVLKRYRGTLDLGVRARVEEPGQVGVGDEVETL